MSIYFALVRYDRTVNGRHKIPRQARDDKGVVWDIGALDSGRQGMLPDQKQLIVGAGLDPPA